MHSFLFYKEQHIPTTRKEFDLMVYFMEHPGIVLPRDTILNAVWEYDYTGDVRTIDTLVKQLRKKNGRRLQLYPDCLRRGLHLRGGHP